MNKKFQDYKKCGVVLEEHLELGIEVKGLIFDIPDERPKEKYNRAREKREFQRRVDDEIDL